MHCFHARSFHAPACVQWDITLAPLNVCRYLTLTPDWFEALARCNPVGAFLRDVHVFYAGFYRTVMGVTSHVLVRHAVVRGLPLLLRSISARPSFAHRRTTPAQSSQLPTHTSSPRPPASVLTWSARAPSR